MYFIVVNSRFIKIYELRLQKLFFVWLYLKLFGKDDFYNFNNGLILYWNNYMWLKLFQQLSHLRIATHIVIALLLGLMYYGFGKDADKVVGNFSFVFFNILFIFFASAMPTVLTCKYSINFF